jgi:hypothetical protein
VKDSEYFKQGAPFISSQSHSNRLRPALKDNEENYIEKARFSRHGSIVHPRGQPMLASDFRFRRSCVYALTSGQRLRPQLALTCVLFLTPNGARLRRDWQQDKYILGSMVILCGVCVWHAIIGAVILPLTLSADDDSDVAVTTAMTVQTTTLAISRGVNATYPLTPLATSNSTTASAITVTTASNTLCPSSGSTTANVTATAQMADNIALGVFGSLYAAFHFVFVGLIYCCVSDTGSLRKTCSVLCFILVV